MELFYLAVTGLIYFHTISSFGVISKNSPLSELQINVFPFGSLCEPPYLGELKSDVGIVLYVSQIEFMDQMQNLQLY